MHVSDDDALVTDNGGRQGNQSPPSESIPGLDPLLVQWILRTKGVDSSVLQCSEDYTTVTVSGDQDVFIDTYQKCVMGNRVKREAITFDVTQNQERHIMLLSECEEKFKQVLFVHDMPQRTLHIVSEDLDQFQSVKKHIQNSLHTFTPSPSQRPHQGTQRTVASVVVISLSDGVKLTVKKGDLLKEQVIAIVNAANECLDHGGGVAFAIDRASGGVVQKLSNELKKRRGGNVPTGQVVLTGGGGKLICKKVIHAVGPDAREHPPDICDKLLHKVCVNILKTSEDNNFTSIAIPPISSGIFAMPKQRVAKILIDTILDYPYRQPSCLKDIRIVIIDDETLRPFTAYATEVKERLQQHSQSPQPTAQQKVPAQQSGQASPSLHTFTPSPSNRPMSGDSCQSLIKSRLSEGRVGVSPHLPPNAPGQRPGKEFADEIATWNQQLKSNNSWSASKMLQLGGITSSVKGSYINKQHPDTKPHPVSVPASLTISTATVDLSINVSATIFTGDTHVANADTIICPLSPGFELNGLSQTLNEITKGLIARNLKDHKEPQPSEGDIVVLNPGKIRELKAQDIIFLIRTKKSSAQVTQEGCLKALKYAEENGCTSLAVPAVLSSKAKEHMTKALLAALKQFTPQHKMEIVLVVPPNDETTLGILRKTLPFENVTHPVEEEYD